MLIRAPHALASVCMGGLLLASSSARGAVDLTVTLAVSSSGDTVTYTATVCATAGKKSDPFKVGLWFNLAATPACNAAPDYEWSSAGLANGCESFSYPRSAVSPGSYTAKVFADRTCVFAEPNENNNVASTSYSVVPDLSSNITAIVAGTTVTYDITVSNLGAAIATPFDVGLYFDRTTAPACGAAPDVTLNLASLGAGQSTSLRHVRAGVPNGSYRAWALADSGCVITAETNKTNNASSVVYAVGPNLYLLAPTISVAGTTVTYSVTVCAQNSSVDIGAYSVALWYNRASAPANCASPTGDYTWTEPGLTKDSCKTLSYVRNGVPLGTYTAWVYADPGCAITETQEDDNLRSKTYVVGGVATADIYLASFRAASNNTDVTYTVSVCNQGGIAAGSFSIGLLFNAATAPACPGGTFDYTWSISALGPGACQNLTYVRNSTPAGAYKGWAFADSGCTVNESNETNNIRSADYAVGQPELTVASFSASVSGSQVNYTVQVCNSGSPAGAFAVGIYGDRATAPDCSIAPNHSLPVASLAAATCTTLTSVDNNLARGAKLAWAFADHLCQLQEGNETNNQRSAPYGIGIDLSDLRVTNLTVTSAGGTVTYLVTVCNSGAAAAPTSDIGLYYDKTAAPQCGDTPDWTSSLPGLAPGECDTRTHVREGVAAGSYKAWARADAPCSVGESDETNNTASHAYQVAASGLDVGVTAVNVSVANDRVTVIATICNLGTVKADGSTAGLFADRAAAPVPCADTPDLKNTVGALDPGQCTETTFVRQGVAAGSYTAWVMADADCSLGESNESNNLSSKPYTVGTPTDGGNPSGEGTQQKPSDGCGCAVPYRTAAGVVPLVLLLLLLAGLRSPTRRRRRQP